MDAICARGLNETTTRRDFMCASAHTTSSFVYWRAWMRSESSHCCLKIPVAAASAIHVWVRLLGHSADAYTKYSLFSIPLRGASRAFHSLLLRLLRNGETRKMIHIAIARTKCSPTDRATDWAKLEASSARLQMRFCLLYIRQSRIWNSTPVVEYSARVVL